MVLAINALIYNANLCIWYMCKLITLIFAMAVVQSYTKLFKNNLLIYLKHGNIKGRLLLNHNPKNQGSIIVAAHIYICIRWLNVHSTHNCANLFVSKHHSDKTFMFSWFWQLLSSISWLRLCPTIIFKNIINLISAINVKNSSLTKIKYNVRQWYAHWFSSIKLIHHFNLNGLQNHSLTTTSYC